MYFSNDLIKTHDKNLFYLLII